LSANLSYVDWPSRRAPWTVEEHLAATSRRTRTAAFRMPRLEPMRPLWL